MLGCFNPTLGQIWTNPAVGLNFVKFLHYIFNPTFRVCPYLTQNWVKTTQHFLECTFSHLADLQIWTKLSHRKEPKTTHEMRWED